MITRGNPMSGNHRTSDFMGFQQGKMGSGTDGSIEIDETRFVIEALVISQRDQATSSRTPSWAIWAILGCFRNMIFSVDAGTCRNHEKIIIEGWRCFNDSFIFDMKYLYIYIYILINEMIIFNCGDSSTTSYIPFNYL